MIICGGLLPDFERTYFVFPRIGYVADQTENV